MANKINPELQKKLDKLNEMMNTGDIENLLNFYPEVIEDIKKDDNIAKDSIMYIYLHIQSLLLELGSYNQECIDLIDEMIEFKEHNEVMFDESELYYSKALCLSWERDFDECRKCMVKAIGLFKESPNYFEFGLARFYSYLGYVNLADGEYEDALKYCKLADKLFKKYQNKNDDYDAIEHALNLENLGDIYLDNEEFSNAIKVSEEAIKIGKPYFEEEVESISKAYDMLIQALCGDNQYDKAKTVYDEFLSISGKCDEPSGYLISSTLFVSSIYFAEENCNKALSLIENIEKYIDDDTDIIDVLELLNCKGDCLIGLGKYYDSKKCFLKIKDILENFDEDLFDIELDHDTYDYYMDKSNETLKMLKSKTKLIPFN